MFIGISSWYRGRSIRQMIETIHRTLPLARGTVVEVP
jgi:hypothetical protein